MVILKYRTCLCHILLRLISKDLDNSFGGVLLHGNECLLEKLEWNGGRRLIIFLTRNHINNGLSEKDKVKVKVKTKSYNYKPGKVLTKDLRCRTKW